jgi:hypothetical protein
MINFEPFGAPFGFHLPTIRSGFGIPVEVRQHQ